MENINVYPKVLIIYISCINKKDQHGVSIREWFADWPQDRLAQIYSGGEVGIEKFCGYHYKLGQNDRKFGNLFLKLKKSSLGQSSYSITLDTKLTKSINFGVWSLYKNKFSEWLINTGLWELIFRPSLSKEMRKFIADFNPKIIYCQGYNLTFTTLPIMIHKKFNIPICFQTGDDWVSSLYKNSPLSLAIRPIVKKKVKSLLSNSAVRLANGDLMAAVYKERYRMPFESVMMCDNLSRFRNAIPKRVVNDSTISIVFTGNLGRDRWVSLIELCEAAKLLQIQNGFKIMITAFATSIPAKAINNLQEKANLQIFPGPTHEDLPSYLKGADILYLPETFEKELANEIRLSISTKAHFYMMSEKPTLVYGSPISGIINYASVEKWACIVQDQDLNKLTLALRMLITDHNYCCLLYTSPSPRDS